jgi:hypothetical protein
VRQQHQDPDHQLRFGAQAVEKRALGGGKGLVTDITVIALLLQAMHANIALPDLAARRALEIRTKDFFSIHGVDLHAKVGLVCPKTPFCQSMAAHHD